MRTHLQDGDGPSIDSEIEREERIGNSTWDVADDVRAALFEHRGQSTDDQQAWQRFCDGFEGTDPVNAFKTVHAVDTLARVRDPQAAVGLVEDWATEPRYLKPERKSSGNEHIDAARDAIEKASRYSRFGEVSEEARDLSIRNGDLSEFIDNTLNVRKQAQSGTPREFVQARATASGHYDGWNRVSPSEAEAIYEMHAVQRLVPELNPADHRYDPGLNRETARILREEGKTWPKSWNAAQLTLHALSQARRRR